MVVILWQRNSFLSLSLGSDDVLELNLLDLASAVGAETVSGYFTSLRFNDELFTLFNSFA